MAPPGNSANTVPSAAEAGSLPMASPPSLSRSFWSRPAVLPAPITTRRDAFRPSGTISSSADPLLPVKRSALAARVTRAAVGPSALAVAGPNLRPSLQNTMRTPLAGAAKGPNPSFKAFDIGGNPYSGKTGGPYGLPVPSAIVHGIPMPIAGMPVNRNGLSPCGATLSDLMRIIYLLGLILGIYLAWFAAQSIFDAAVIPLALTAATRAGQIIHHSIVLICR